MQTKKTAACPTTMVLEKAPVLLVGGVILLIYQLFDIRLYHHEKPHVKTPQGAHLMVCNRSWHLPGNPKLMWHPARLIKEGGCVDLSMDTLHLKDPLVFFVSEGSALTLPHFLLSPRIIMPRRCS